jgi:hypothetical protein
MTNRQRYIEALTFGTLDKIPFEPGEARESTLTGWKNQGLPAGVDWFKYLIEILGIDYDFPKSPLIDLDVDFRLIPQFEEKVLEHKNGHYVVQDWKGNICEISDEFDVTYLREARDFVTRKWIKCPVSNREDWEQMKERYNPNDPARFPIDFINRCKRASTRDYPLRIEIPGPFWQLREWCGFEGLCMLTVDDPELVSEMATFWSSFVSNMLQQILDHIVFDRLFINEDMAYKAKAMISPDMTRKFLQPSWKLWSTQVQSAGVPIVDMDSDGYIGELIPIWIESGINVCDPIEVAAHNDIKEYRDKFQRTISYRMGVDKRAIAKGGQEIRKEMKRLEPVIRDGGYIPGCDHGVPNDVSWPNFVEYSHILAQMTGWL